MSRGMAEKVRKKWKEREREKIGVLRVGALHHPQNHAIQKNRIEGRKYYNFLSIRKGTKYKFLTTYDKSPF